MVVFKQLHNWGEPSSLPEALVLNVCVVVYVMHVSYMCWCGGRMRWEGPRVFHDPDQQQKRSRTV